ncbi:hypothetical protein N7449_005071 [Penicillium cf. viridicatum]|uniref:Uncharacterized protein n=1 Tax=Penicillium cf. viridicatum TaxID=2972119 RepID=A0A9W9MKJ7_9EURO|nr:hypothetical protein N7449_005071 [Penicillium cf. viridicatum]
MLSPPEQEAETRNTLTTLLFQPILKVLADLERDDSKFAFPAARLVGLYRRLWESCVSKYIDGEKLEQRNLALKEAVIPAALFRTGIGIILGTTDQPTRRLEPPF